MRGCWCLLLMLLCCVSVAETLITKAKIAEVTERGFVFTVGTESIPASDESQTKFWKGLKPAKKADFKAGDAVTVRLKTDDTPTVLRELCDDGTSDFLNKVRKESMSCTVVKVEPKNLVVRFDNGAEFVYRHSDKSKATLSGASASVTDLKEGQKVHVKGRLLPTLDTWVVEATDVKPAPVAKATKSTKKAPQPKPLKLSSSGKIKGVVDLHQPHFNMVDLVVQQRLLHVTYTSTTIFKLEGAKADRTAIQRGLWAEVTYRRDNYGRLIAHEIKLYHGER